MDKKTKTLRVRVSEKDQKRIKEYAKYKDQDLSSIVRNYLIGSARRAGL